MLQILYFLCTFIESIGTKVRQKIWESCHGHSQGVLKTSRALMYRVHRTVIFAIAQLSCFRVESSHLFYICNICNVVDFWC